MRSDVTRRLPGVGFGQTQARLDCAGLIFTESVYPEGCRTERHTHDAPFFYFVLDGSCCETVPGQTHGRDTLVFLPAGEPHATHWPEPEGRSFHLEFIGTGWQERLSAAGLDRGRACSDGLPRWLATRLHAEFRRRDALSPLSLEGLALELVAESARLLLPAEAGPPRWLRAVKDRLHDEFASAFSLEQLAQAADVHPAHLACLFRREYGCTAGDYVRRLRVEYACRLLLSGDTPIGVIAHHAGFTDQSHFTKTFRCLTGQTPAEFRRQAPGKRQTKKIILVQDE